MGVVEAVLVTVVAVTVVAVTTVTTVTTFERESGGRVGEVVRMG